MMPLKRAQTTARKIAIPGTRSQHKKAKIDTKIARRTIIARI